MTSHPHLPINITRYIVRLCWELTYFQQHLFTVKECTMLAFVSKEWFEITKMVYNTTNVKILMFEPTLDDSLDIACHVGSPYCLLSSFNRIHFCYHRVHKNRFHNSSNNNNNNNSKTSQSNKKPGLMDKVKKLFVKPPPPVYIPPQAPTITDYDVKSNEFYQILSEKPISDEIATIYLKNLNKIVIYDEHLGDKGLIHEMLPLVLDWKLLQLEKNTDHVQQIAYIDILDLRYLDFILQTLIDRPMLAKYIKGIKCHLSTHLPRLLELMTNLVYLDVNVKPETINTNPDLTIDIFKNISPTVTKLIYYCDSFIPKMEESGYSILRERLPNLTRFEVCSIHVPKLLQSLQESQIIRDMTWYHFTYGTEEYKQLCLKSNIINTINFYSIIQFNSNSNSSGEWTLDIQPPSCVHSLRLQIQSAPTNLLSFPNLTNLNLETQEINVHIEEFIKQSTRIKSLRLALSSFTVDHVVLIMDAIYQSKTIDLTHLYFSIKDVRDYLHDDEREKLTVAKSKLEEYFHIRTTEFASKVPRSFSTKYEIMRHWNYNNSS